VGFLEVSHFNAWMLENGNILVCVYDTQEEEASVLVLQEKGDSFIFLQGFALV
jgi:hypothetical protein